MVDLKTDSSSLIPLWQSMSSSSLFLPEFLLLRAIKIIK